MKPRHVDLSGAGTPRGLIDRVLAVRLQEALALASELEHRQPRGLHDFRIACKRLRYALERFATADSSFEGLARHLASVQDALGEAHDRDVLLAILPLSMPETELRLRRQREEAVDRAKELWNALSVTLSLSKGAS